MAKGEEEEEEEEEVKEGELLASTPLAWEGDREGGREGGREGLESVADVEQVPYTVA